MKKSISLFLTLVVTCGLLAGCTTPQASSEDVSIPVSESVESSKEPVTNYTESTVDLGIGTMQVYDFGTIKLHAYKTNDAIDDECFLIESSDELVALEAPGFKDNISEYRSYIDSLNKPLNNVLLAYHPSGAETLSDTANYLATAGAETAQKAGGSVKGLIDGFVESFGDSYDGTIPAVTEVIEPGTLTFGGIEFVITEGTDGFDIVIPEINCAFTHMVGADVHNIMPGVDAMDALAAQMQAYIDADYALILSSHYVPETIDAAKTKLAYVQKMKELAESNNNAADFITAVNAEFPEYLGANYLEMTASGLYQ